MNVNQWLTIVNLLFLCTFIKGQWLPLETALMKPLKNQAITHQMVRLTSNLGYNFLGLQMPAKDVDDNIQKQPDQSGQFNSGQIDIGGTEKLVPNLENADLKNAALDGAYLMWANLANANLEHANLKGADLSWANLSHSNLYRANLSGASLQGANLERANLEEANLSNANFVGTNLLWVNLKNANLAGTNLKKTFLTWANLEGAQYNNETQFPTDFNPLNYQMVKVQPD